MRFLPLSCALLMSAGLMAQHNADGTLDEIACNEAAAQEQVMRAAALGVDALTADYDLKYYRFEWTIDPAVYFIDGRATVYFQTLEDHFAEINFDFSTDLTVSSVMYHGAPLSFSQAGDYLLTIQLPGELSAMTLDSMTIAYSGMPPSGGFGSFVQSNHNGTPIIWTLSEPYGAETGGLAKTGSRIRLTVSTCTSLLLTRTALQAMVSWWKRRHPVRTKFTIGDTVTPLPRTWWLWPLQTTQHIQTQCI